MKAQRADNIVRLKLLAFFVQSCVKCISLSMLKCNNTCMLDVLVKHQYLESFSFLVDTA